MKAEQRFRGQEHGSTDFCEVAWAVALETSGIVLIAGAEEKIISASFAAKRPSGKFKRAVFANQLETNRALAHHFYIIRRRTNRTNLRRGHSNIIHLAKLASLPKMICNHFVTLFPVKREK